LPCDSGSIKSSTIHVPCLDQSPGKYKCTCFNCYIEGCRVSSFWKKLQNRFVVRVPNLNIFNQISMKFWKLLQCHLVRSVHFHLNLCLTVAFPTVPCILITTRHTRGIAWESARLSKGNNIFIHEIMLKEVVKSCNINYLVKF
jgi:hypothetical protein